MSETIGTPTISRIADLVTISCDSTEEADAIFAWLETMPWNRRAASPALEKAKVALKAANKFIEDELSERRKTAMLETCEYISEARTCRQTVIEALAALEDESDGR